MLLMFLLAVIVLLAIFIILAVSLSVSKAINGVFFGLFGNLFVVVKVFCWLKKIFLIGIILKLLSKEKKAKEADEKAD